MTKTTTRTSSNVAADAYNSDNASNDNTCTTANHNNNNNSYFKMLSNGEIDRLSRWDDKWTNQYNGKPGFHLQEVNPNLKKFYMNKQFNPPKNKPILLPLCGKTLDLKWLSENHKGSYIVGVEGIKIAIEELRNESLPSLREIHVSSSIDDDEKEKNEQTTVWTTAKDDNEWFINDYVHDEAENDSSDSIINVVCTDFFDLSPSLFISSASGGEHQHETLPLPLFGGIFDRGSLVAIPPSSRIDYVKIIDSMLHNDGGQILLVTLEKHENKNDGPPFSMSVDDVNALFNSYGYYDTLLVDKHESEVKGIMSTEYVFVITKRKKQTE